MVFIKKVILLIVLLFTFSVQAKEVRMYKYYKLDKVYGDYALEGSIDYPYLDNDDFIYSDYYYSSEYPSLNDLEVETITNYEYRRTKDINYINIQNNSNDIQIDKIEVRYDGKLLNYRCDELSNGTFTLEKRKDITLYLDKEYDQMRMTVRVISNANYNLIYFVTGDDSSRQTIFRTEIGNDYTWNACEGTYYNYAKWVDDVYPYRLLNSRIAQFKKELVSYKYRYKLFHYYNFVRNYYDEFLFEPYGDYVYRDDDIYRDYVFDDGSYENVDNLEKEDNYKNDNDLTKAINVYNDNHFFEEKIYVPDTGL